MLNEEITTQREKLINLNDKLSELSACNILDIASIERSQITPGSNEALKALKQELKVTKDAATNADKALKKAQTAAAAQMADQALVKLLEQGGNIVQLFEGPASLLQELLNGCKKKQFVAAAFFVVDDGEKLHLGALSGVIGQEAGHMAGKLIQSLAPLAGGKGGGKPDMARGAAPQRDKAEDILTEATSLLLS